MRQYVSLKRRNKKFLIVIALSRLLFFTILIISWHGTYNELCKIEKKKTSSYSEVVFQV